MACGCMRRGRKQGMNSPFLAIHFCPLKTKNPSCFPFHGGNYGFFLHPQILQEFEPPTTFLLYLLLTSSIMSPSTSPSGPLAGLSSSTSDTKIPCRFPPQIWIPSSTWDFLMVTVLGSGVLLLVSTEFLSMAREEEKTPKACLTS